ncbi:MAG: hypothetical protein JW765_10240 [Deltaproteobacteria bacterium]|nr:hypothetical protein [Candidatus Zymogenaceae bacterium]
MKKAIIFSCIVVALFFATASARSEQGGLPDLTGGAVTIPWSDFKELIKDLIAPPPPPPAPPAPPADYSVSSVAYTGRLEGDSAVFSASFAVVVLAEKKWVEVPLLSSEAAISDVTMDGVPVTLSVRNGMYVIITDKPGTHTVSLKFFVPVDTGAGPNAVDIPLPEVPSSTLRFSVPRPGLDIQITPAHFRKVTPSGGSTTLDAVLPVTDRALISWSPAVREEISGTLRVQAQVNTIISVGEGIMKGVTTVSYDISHGTLSTFSVVVPAGIDILDVSGDAVRDWKAVPNGDTSTILINTGFAVSGTTNIVLLYERNMGGTTADIDVPQIEVNDVVREIGYLAVTASTKVGIEEISSKNLAGLDSSELPPDLVSASENPILFSYKYLKYPYALRLSVVTYEDIPSLTTVVKKADLASLLTVRGDLVTRAVFEIKNNVKQFMRLSLPEGSTLWSAYVSDRPVKPSVDKDGTILIPLDRSARTDTSLTSFVVEVVYITETKPLGALLGRREFIAPVIDIQTDAQAWTVYLPERYSYRSVGKDMEPSTPAPIGYGSDMGMNAPALAPMEEMDASDEVYRGDFEKKEEPRSQIYMEKNIYAEGLSAMGGVTGMKGVLPVKLDIPFSGRPMSFSKAIVSPGERSTIRIRYEGKGVSGLLFYIGMALFGILFVSLIIALRQSLEVRRVVIDRRLAALFGGSLIAIILIAVFLIMDTGAAWWGLVIAVLIGGGLFARDLIEKIKEMARQSKEEHIKREKERSKLEKKHEK